ncbi:MAG: helix-turn-helix domain-containing protein [Oscillospiraceae bacterium]|jgi:transcriptional regulator with XRE-family HTH domain|nr:helix-turn-helix domain-containing protein [Oscillospiraceae bacterium]
MFSKEVFRGRLRACSEAKSLNQQAAADALGLSFNRVNNWFRGIAVPSLDVAIELADILDVSLDYLTGRTDNPTRL